MTNIDMDVDQDEDEEYLAVRISVLAEEPADGPEEWQVRLLQLDASAPKSEYDVADGVVLATAIVYRTHFIDADWFDRMDSVDQQLASVGEEFTSRGVISIVNPDSTLAAGLAII